MDAPKKIAFVFGNTTYTLTPDDIEAVWSEWEASNPGKDIRQMPADEFTKKCMDRLKANAKPTRTVLHN